MGKNIDQYAALPLIPNEDLNGDPEIPTPPAKIEPISDPEISDEKTSSETPSKLESLKASIIKLGSYRKVSFAETQSDEDENEGYV